MNGFYESDGARLGFRDTGAGQPVVFLHPTPLDGEYWRPLIEEMGRIRAIVPDLRGHGVSELGKKLPVGGFGRVPDAPVLTMAQLASDVLALLDHLALPEAVFAGCSIGGYVLLELWRKSPELMSGLAFVCSKPQPDAEVNLAKRAAIIAQARAGGTGALFDGMAQSLIGRTARERNLEIVARFGAHGGNDWSTGAGHCRRRGFGSDADRDAGLQRRAGWVRVSPAARRRALCRL